MTLDLLGRLVTHEVIYEVPRPSLTSTMLKHRPVSLKLAMAMDGLCNLRTLTTLWCICLAVAVANVVIAG